MKKTKAENTGLQKDISGQSLIWAPLQSHMLSILYTNSWILSLEE